MIKSSAGAGRGASATVLRLQPPLEIRPGTRPATSGQFQFPGPNWPRVTPGDSPGHFPTPGGRFEDQFGSVQANFGPNSSPAGSNSSPTGFNSSSAGSKSSPAGSKSSPAGSFETRVWSLVPGLISSVRESFQLAAGKLFHTTAGMFSASCGGVSTRLRKIFS